MTLPLVKIYRFTLPISLVLFNLLQTKASNFNFNARISSSSSSSSSWSSSGDEAGLVMLKSLAYGNYSVPLVVEDQQGGRVEEDLVFVVTICDCDGKDTCRGKLPASTGADPSLIGLACGATLFFRKSAII